jgi:hypothetical protein
VTITELKRANNPHQPVGRWIRPQKRLAIYLRDKMRCCVCLACLWEAPKRDITLDHVRPRVKGGSNDERNLFTACRDCNTRRGAKPLASFAPAAVNRIAYTRKRPLDMTTARQLYPAFKQGEDESMSAHDMDGSFKPNLKRYDRIGKAVIIEFLEEPNTGLAIIEEVESRYRHKVPVWLLEMAR